MNLIQCVCRSAAFAINSCARHTILCLLLALTITGQVLANRSHLHYPVVLVPGIIGSRAYVKPRGELDAPFRQIWLNISSLLHPRNLTREFGLTYLNTTNRSYDNEEFEVTFPGWGDTTNLEFLDESQKLIGQYFNRLVERLLKTQFYHRNISIRGAPYDFRRAPHENINFLSEFKNLIEETYVQNKKKKIVILAHSLGTLYSLYFLHSQSNEWKRTYLEAFVSVSGPYGGSARVMAAFASGYNLGVPFYPSLSLRHLLRSFTSMALLLPDERLWSPAEPLLITPNYNYSVHDMKRLFEDIDYAIGYNMFQTAKHAMDYLNRPAGVHNVYCIHGTGVATVEKAMYKPATSSRKPFPDQLPQFVHGDGDGTVNLRSLTVLST
ncbi:unnamed protein product [Dicrocoelium dendriticum]|nr:unnamed protein product [Dicrocoelium dendriticum]